MSKNIICGYNCVYETIKNNKVEVLYLNRTKKIKEIEKIAAQKKIKINYVDKNELDKITETKNHQGIAALGNFFNYISLEEMILTKEFIIILDEVQDVNNFGAILRSCDAFGVKNIIIPKNRSVSLNSTVAKISTGAFNYINICSVTNIKQTIKKLKENDYWIGALDMHGNIEISESNFYSNVAMIIGGENKGITPNIKKDVDFIVNIPMYGHVNSLNVSNATAILLYEFSKNKDERKKQQK